MVYNINDLYNYYKYENIENLSLYGILCNRRTSNDKYEIYVPFSPIIHEESFSVEAAVIENCVSLYKNWTNMTLVKCWSGFFIKFDYPSDLSNQYGKAVNVYTTIIYPVQ